MTSTLRRRVATTVVAGAAALALAACSSGAPAETEAPEDGSLGTIRVGALPVPAGDMLTWVDENLAAEAGLDIEWVEFTDYNTPNPALTDGSTEANLFQNATFMETYNSQAGGSLVSVGEVYLPAAAFYSESLTSIDELGEGATIAIPNDPTNEARALEILAAEGLIEIADDATNLDGITENPSNFQFTEVENATLPLALPDNDAVFVTASFALPAGLTQEQAILTEGDDSEYFNILATTPELEDDPRVEALYELLTSEETQAYILETWGGLIVPVSE
ncbi:MetQ/NlpA family ABC transporter substrate-binding protein [Agrococcus lahaulensis]|uniref:MetQ/NlpA family ABC transporter substrate-binding protein n=1 Tax=Agrococcus sp. SCSIO52902 TaxID=2933290 RepID=UPI000FE32A21|nr:MetQ/NlpA family ABC transporter substrate-binding protein [Agrococcus sp. SCSIO52902]RWR21202.1 MetQ/NlpA family ABC transporter substrate-binding protein [Agrococcus lahaulensis]UOW01512.1 MetQ/NlpA family ABC transporter substrate-binding protein [Agrococcus sp. SCSIO52902]